MPTGLLEALTAPFALLPNRAAISPPAVLHPPVVADSGAAANAPSQTAANLAAIDPAKPREGAASRRIDSAPAPRLFDSPMHYLTSHLIPIVRSPFALPSRMPGFVQLWAQHPWPFGQSLAQRLENSLDDNTVAIAAVVVTALTAMTGLAVAGGALSGRPLRHTAWRSGRTRYRPGLPWDMVDAPAESGVRLPAEDQVAAWPGMPAAAPAGDAGQAPGERRVA